jgi:hypothetical protein
MTALDDLLALKAERYERTATVFEWATGKQWTMPATEWLLDECTDFTMAGKLDDWLVYYNHFEGLD